MEDAKVKAKVKVRGKANTPGLLRKELRTLAVFVEIYCKAKHSERKPFVLKGFENLDGEVGHTVEVCGECAKLLAHALVKRSRCPMDPKPACKDCLSHCYQASYRTQMQKVMRFSGT